MTFDEAVGRIFSYEGIQGDGRSNRKFYVVRNRWVRPHVFVIDLETHTLLPIYSPPQAQIPEGWKEILPP